MHLFIATHLSATNANTRKNLNPNKAELFTCGFFWGGGGAQFEPLLDILRKNNSLLI